MSLLLAGAGLRLPGLSSPSDLRECLRARRSLITACPAGQFGVSWAAWFGEFSSRSSLPEVLLAEVVAAALADAGLEPESLKRSETGFYLGVTHGRDAVSWSRVCSELCRRYGWRGPALVVDTGCSGGAVAAHLACQGLRSGDCHRAVVASAQFLPAAADMEELMARGVLAGSVRCPVFSQQSQGYCPGEGAAAIVLESRAAAADKGVRILSSAVNHNGPSGQLEMPSGSAQSALVAKALSAADLEPEALGFVETSAVGHAFGDSVEAHALGACLGNRAVPVLLGSSRANLGNLGPLSGLLGLIKIALMLEHNEILPNLHWDEASPSIPWGKLGVEPALREGRFAGRLRRAGVHSLGNYGTNAHCILSWAGSDG